MSCVQDLAKFVFDFVVVVQISFKIDERDSHLFVFSVIVTKLNVVVKETWPERVYTNREDLHPNNFNWLEKM